MRFGKHTGASFYLEVWLINVQIWYLSIPAYEHCQQTILLTLSWLTETKAVEADVGMFRFQCLMNY